MKRYKENIKNVDLDQKISHLPHYGIFHNKTVTLNHILMPIIRYNFRKIQWTDLKKSSKVLILDPKMAHFSYFLHNKNFLAKSKTITYPIFDICHLVQFQKNLMNRSREKFKNVDLGPKITHLPHFEQNKIFFQKRSSSLFSVYGTLTLWKKPRKT